MTKKKQTHKPLIETIINTSALALTAFGVQQITMSNWEGYGSLLLGVMLEFAKYWGRKEELW